VTLHPVHFVGVISECNIDYVTGISWWTPIWDVCNTKIRGHNAQNFWPCC